VIFANKESFIGMPMLIENTCEEFVLTKKQKKSNKAHKLLILDKFNNLFLDIKSVQRTMIHIYKITLEVIELLVLLNNFNHYSI